MAEWKISQEEKNKAILNADNSENRKYIESCVTKSKWVLNPIIDWSDAEIWEFLDHYGCKSNPLYQCRFKRIGCIACPMARSHRQKIELERYPKYKDMYIRTFEKMLISRKENGLHCAKWSSGVEVFDWWLSEHRSRDGNQLSLFDESF